MSTLNLQTGDICSFELYPAAMIGTNFVDVIYQDRISYNSVHLFGVDPNAEHVRVYPTLPPGSPNDPAAYNWLSFKTQNGDLVVVGELWIKPETLVVNQQLTYYVTIYNANENTPTEVRQALNALGYYEIAISTKI